MQEKESNRSTIGLETRLYCRPSRTELEQNLILDSYILTMNVCTMNTSLKLCKPAC